jgi:NAD(P)-dependent dehydrogenase (short-subunit alcohol dehydrogenase family)
MNDIPYGSALIIGGGPGISGSLARFLRAADIPVVIASRHPDRLANLASETGAVALPVDAAHADQVAELFIKAEAQIGSPEIVVYNASGRVRKPIIDLAPDNVDRAIAATALGAFYSVQQAARRMLPKSKGAILLIGATAGVKGFAQSSPFAMGKFAFRGLAQSAARELMPKGIHVAHIVVDGAVRPADGADAQDQTLHPDVAQSYLDLRQHRSAWSWEIEVRPWVEQF